MRRLLDRVPSLVAWTLAACVQVSTGDGTSSRAAPIAPDASADGLPSGVDCVTDAQSRVVLCRAIDTCPGLVVEPGAFPDCGFRLSTGAPIVIECLCSNALCPLGSTASCEEASTLLAAQNALFVCAQIADGRCVDLSQQGMSGVSTCDKTCAAECAGDPSCFQLCGC